MAPGLSLPGHGDRYGHRLFRQYQYAGRHRRRQSREPDAQSEDAVYYLDQKLTLTAVVKDQFGNLMNPSLNWSSSGGSLAPNQTSAVLSVNDTARTIHIVAATIDGVLSMMPT